VSTIEQATADAGVGLIPASGTFGISFSITCAAVPAARGG
jgi:hypothetical protein